jgi:mannose/fructose/sorbose-specific phosphotransferase system IIA component
VIGIVIVGHGKLAEGLMDALRMIGGKHGQLEIIELHEGDSPDMLEAELRGLIDTVDKGDGVLVMTDLFGATPFNVSARLAMEREDMEVITGFSLAMLLETVFRREGASLEELTAIAADAGRSGIRILSETLAE